MSTWRTTVKNIDRDLLQVLERIHPGEPLETSSQSQTSCQNFTPIIYRVRGMRRWREAGMGKEISLRNKKEFKKYRFQLLGNLVMGAFNRSKRKTKSTDFEGNRYNENPQ